MTNIIANIISHLGHQQHQHHNQYPADESRALLDGQGGTHPVARDAKQRRGQPQGVEHMPLQHEVDERAHVAAQVDQPRRARCLERLGAQRRDEQYLQKSARARPHQAVIGANQQPDAKADGQRQLFVYPGLGVAEAVLLRSTNTVTTGSAHSTISRTVCSGNMLTSWAPT